MILRQFNSAGVETFRRFLKECRETPKTVVPTSILEEAALAEPVYPRIEISRRSLTTKAEAAEFLADLLSPLPDHEVARNAGLWTWLTLLLFDEVCPPRNGNRVVRNDYSYIFEPENQRHFYRHLLYIPWRVIKVAGTHNRLFLNGRLSVLDKATSEVMKRLYITRIPCIFEVLDRLYWDASRGRIRAGMVSPGRVREGDLTHRLPVRIRQLEMTYDLQSLTSDQLIELLGDEFRQGQPKVRA